MGISQKLMSFINSTPNAYYCTENIKNMLLKENFIELVENNEWDLKDGEKYFVIRNDSSIIAFNYNESMKGFNIVASHGDSPSYRIKPNPDIFTNGYLKLNVEGYGGMMHYSWLDRPLSIAGRLIIKKDDELIKKNINIDKDLLVIPSQAIHINRTVNENNPLNVQNDMLPIISNNKTSFKSILVSELINKKTPFNSIVDYDLYLYNRDKSKYYGLSKEFILAPRLDDLGCVYPSLMGFINSKNNNNTNVFCVFNNEEIGSLTMQGADSSFLSDVLNRIGGNNIHSLLGNSFMVSADNAHAMHPNAVSKSDPTNTIMLNRGVVIKHHNNYTTDGLSSAIFKTICDYTPYQDFACRSDMKCGSTLGGISISHVSIYSVDIGLPQLSMHSALETVGTDDIKYMYDVIKKFYSSTIIYNHDKVKVIK